MEGQEFLTINPDTLSDPKIWSYRDLQKIAKAVGLHANGRREKLVQSLDEWHRSRKDGTKTLVESTSDETEVVNLDMNVVGNNFAILAVKVQAVPDATTPIAPPGSPQKALKRKLSSIVGFGEEGNDVGVVSPTYLRPLRAEPATPGKSCLKRVSSYSNYVRDDDVSDRASEMSDSQNMDPVANIPSVKSSDSVSSVDSFNSCDDEDGAGDCQFREKAVRCSSGGARRLSNICFSPFNGVRVIAHREEDVARYAEEAEYQREVEGDNYWFKAFW